MCPAPNARKDFMLSVRWGEDDDGGRFKHYRF